MDTSKKIAILPFFVVKKIRNLTVKKNTLQLYMSAKGSPREAKICPWIPGNRKDYDFMDKGRHGKVAVFFAEEEM